jgi:hypothetical protein
MGQTNDKSTALLHKQHCSTIEKSENEIDDILEKEDDRRELEQVQFQFQLSLLASLESNIPKSRKDLLEGRFTDGSSTPLHCDTEHATPTVSESMKVILNQLIRNRCEKQLKAIREYALAHPHFIDANLSKSICAHIETRWRNLEFTPQVSDSPVALTTSS